jgi:alcohol dehydrogenase
MARMRAMIVPAAGAKLRLEERDIPGPWPARSTHPRPSSLGGTRAILATVTDAAAMQAVGGGLGVNGTLIVVGAVGALSIELLRKRAAVRGWYSGGPIRKRPSALASSTKVASMNEIFPLEQAPAA